MHYVKTDFGSVLINLLIVENIIAQDMKFLINPVFKRHDPSSNMRTRKGTREMFKGHENRDENMLVFFNSPTLMENELY